MAANCLESHTKYFKHIDFLEKKDNYKSEILNRFNFTADQFQNVSKTVFPKLHEFLVEMSNLTGLVLLKSPTSVYYGTGLVMKVRRQADCQCPNEGPEKRPHAIVTVSTAYHLFTDLTKITPSVTFQKANEIWGKSEQKMMKLQYNDTDLTIDNLLRSQDLKTLYGQRLIETDQDLDYESDWCAAEFVTHDEKLITTLEETVSQYQTKQAELYKLSQEYKDVNLVVIIGHPHYWAKRISIGRTIAGQEKQILKEIRHHQTWCRYHYDATTCIGSSGSPVFKWGQSISGFGYWFGHPHNHSEFGWSTIGVEHSL